MSRFYINWENTTLLRYDEMLNMLAPGTTIFQDIYVCVIQHTHFNPDYCDGAKIWDYDAAAQVVSAKNREEAEEEYLETYPEYVCITRLSNNEPVYYACQVDISIFSGWQICGRDHDILVRGIGCGCLHCPERACCVDALCQGGCDDYSCEYNDQGAERLDGVLNSYHSSHHNEFKFEYPDDRKKILHIGAELEVEGNWSDESKLADAVMDIVGENIATCERDGSLNCGFENITQPSTKSTLKQTLCKIAERCEEAGCFPDGSSHTGLHFHLDMSYLTGKDQGSWTGLRGDHTKLKAFSLVESLYQDCRMELIDRRDGEYEYCERQVPDSTLKIKDTLMKYEGIKSRQKNYQRYSLVNCNNSCTVELRFFHGELDTDYLKMAVDFAAAVAYLTKTLELEQLMSFTFQGLVKFTLKNSKQYPDLNKYLHDKKLLKAIK